MKWYIMLQLDYRFDHIFPYLMGFIFIILLQGSHFLDVYQLCATEM